MVMKDTTEVYTLRPDEAARATIADGGRGQLIIGVGKTLRIVMSQDQGRTLLTDLQGLVG